MRLVLHRDDARGSRLDTFLVGDYMMAYVLGIAFQYFTIAPMRGISGPKGILAAIKADSLSLTAYPMNWWLVKRGIKEAM